MPQTLEQFGQTIKVKYPQYKDIPDADLGQKMLTKFPQYKDIVSPADPTVGGTVGKLFTGSTQAFGRDIGEGAEAPRNAGLYADATAQHADLQNQLQNRIRVNKARGKDTTALEKALADHIASAPKLENFTGDVVNKTNEQVLGDAAGTGLEALSGGALSSGAETLGAKSLSTLEKLKQGAKIGAAYGVVGGATKGLQNNEGASDVLKDSAIGGLEGGATGAALEGVGIGIKKTNTGKRLFGTAAEKEGVKFQKDLDNAEKSIYPTLTKNEKATAVLKDEKGLFGKKSVPDLQHTPATKSIIESTATLPNDIKIKPTDTIVQKESKLNQGISRLHQATANDLAQPEVKAATTFQPNKYQSFMKEKILDPIEGEFGLDSKEYATAKKGIDLSQKQIAENNAYGVHSGRQTFDSQFKKTYPQAFKQQKTLFGQLDPHVRNVIETGQNIRTAMNDFAEDLLPENHPFRANLKQESNLIRAKQELRKRTTTDLNKNAVTRALNRNPVAKKTAHTLSSIFKLKAGVDLIDHL